MGRKFDFNYIVIGSGPAGTTVATNLAKAKKKVAIVEGGFLGGSNLNTRDIPYAVALDFAHTYKKTISFPELKNQDLSFSLPTIVARELKTVINSGGGSKAPLESAGVICLQGYANFLDNHTIAVGDRKFTSANFILATGSKLKITDIAGTENVNYLTPETAIKVRRLPQAVMVIGGGSTGCEIAEYFAELGTKVLIAESKDRILPREDKEVSETISDYFTRKLGIMVLPKCKVTAIEQDEISKRVIFKTDNTEKMVRVDCIVLATGSEPILAYGLENAGVKYKETGVIVDKLFQTSAKNIYAIGDCIGGDSSTDRAELEATILSSNIINRTKNLISYKGLIRITNTFPTVATVGINEQDLKKQSKKGRKTIINLDEIPASKIYNFTHGFLKLVTDRNYHILGATIVAPHADLIAQEISLAIRHNLSTREIASTPHITNSWNYIIKLAAKKVALKKIQKKNA